MNFPHSTVRQNATRDRHDYRAMLAIATKRQANSQTARAIASATATTDGPAEAKRDLVDQLIQYFATGERSERSPSGSFFPVVDKPNVSDLNNEFGIYQNASANIKADDLDDGGTGDQSNHAGHGALRTLC